jgi:riboflavin synthase
MAIAMFTGIVQRIGRVESWDGRTLAVLISHLLDEQWQIGESIAIDGCCLTLVSFGSVETLHRLVFELSEETVARTALGSIEPGTRVNFERAMRASDRLGGHFVLGHVDGVAEVVSTEVLEGSWIMTFRVPEDRASLIIDKGSVTLAGISLTVVKPTGGVFQVAVIPHTWAATTLCDRVPGDMVSVEYDMIAKHVERVLALRTTNE